jgi:uncharacterized protein YjbJ (UPF0337 family)
MNAPCRHNPARGFFVPSEGGDFAWNARPGSDVDVVIAPSRNMRTIAMNKDRIQGSYQQAKGKMKEVAGKVTGDSKLETEGKVQQVAGKVQNAVGGFKDAVKEAVDN